MPSPISFCLGLFCLSSHLFAEIRISEFLASNQDGLVTLNGETSDWIEIVNVGDEDVALDGYSLSDDASDLRKWNFPNGTEIAAGEFLIVFASNDPPSGDELHANFKLSAGGEYLALTDAGGTVLTEFAPRFPPQEKDVSFGLSDDGLRKGYFLTSTPSAVNGEPGGSPVKDTKFSVTRGTYDAPFALTISSETDDATIRYTTDGSEPTATHGTIHEEAIAIDGTTVIRAIAYKDGALPTNIDTHTYLFVSDITTQNADGSAPAAWPSERVNGQVYDYGMDPEITDRYSQGELESALRTIPSIMVTVDQADFSGASGINSNALLRGRAWERAAHVEFLNHDNDKTLAARCGIRIRGGSSRKDSNAKHSLRLFFRSEYGLPTLKAPLFGIEGTDEFKKLDLRFDQSFSFMRANRHRWATYLHELVTRDLQREAGQPYTRSRYHHIYINGIYWGLGMTQERSEANFGASYLGGSADDYDVLKSGGNQNGYRLEASDGEFNGDWKLFWELARDQFADPTSERYLEMQGLGPEGIRDPDLPVLLDVDNLVHYILTLGYSGAFDNSLSIHLGGSNNWFSIRNRESDDRGFTHFMHDGENSFGAASTGWANWSDRLNITKWDSQRGVYSRSNPQFIHFDLAQSTPDYRLRFGDLAHAALFNGGHLTADRVLALVNEHAATIDQAIIAETARWGDFTIDPPADRAGWLSSVETLRGLIAERGPLLLTDLREAGLYSQHDAATFEPFSVPVMNGAEVAVTAPEGVIYLTTDGSDPRLSDGSANPAASVITSGETVVITEPVFLSTRVFFEEEWSPLTKAYYSTEEPPTAGELTFSALMIDPADVTADEIAMKFDDSSDFEYVEIVNLAGGPRDLSGVEFRPLVAGDHLEGLRFTFPEMTLLEPGQRLVVAANLEALASRHAIADTSRLFGPFEGRLSNGGEGLLLVGADGSDLVRFEYDNENPWPEFVEGEALFMTSLHRATEEDDGRNWIAREPGTPGETPTPLFSGNAWDDLDGDGSPALLEYFFGRSDGDGISNRSEVIAQEDEDGIHAILTFERDPAALNVSKTIQISKDLALWTDVPEAPLTMRTILDDENLRESYRIHVPPDFGMRFFVRLRVTAEE